jgi:Domain of unknown function (DUF5069)
MKTVREPRSGSVEIAATPWLARMIDKARLEAAGEIEQFDLDYPCPMDQRLLQNLGISAEKFQKIAVEASTDEEIVQALKLSGVNIQ